MSHQLLIIEADSTPAESSVRGALEFERGFNCESLSWDRLTPETLTRKDSRAIVAVAVPHTPEVTHVFEWFRDNPAHAPTLVVLPPEPSDPLMRLTAQVSDDFLLSPIRMPEFRQRLGRVLGNPNAEVEDVRERLLEEMGMTQLVGRDPAFLDAVQQVPRFARFEAPVLITGETGTGKELCARAIHFLSKRRDYPFIAVDCGTLPDHLVENELFGHARGAYTDAHHDQRGLVAMAEGGTLFLDEVDALSLAAQGKLLRFLQERSFRPLGSDRFQQSDVNVTAATNRDLEVAVGAKRFRADLFYRLNVLRLHLPPLRDRASDIGLLASRFLAERRGAAEASARSFSAAALCTLMLHDWPGNVRELHNVVQRAAVVCEGKQIQARHISLARPSGLSESGAQPFRHARAAAVTAFERRYIENLLRKHGGNVTRAAREAQKDRRVLGRLIRKHDIDRRAFS